LIIAGIHEFVALEAQHRRPVGSSFRDIRPNPPDSVHAADLYAVSLLSITVTNRQGRLLLDDGDAPARAAQLLAAIPPVLAITDLTPGVLASTWEL
jgi:hypothetical protein